jgi:hypothetical protein
MPFEFLYPRKKGKPVDSRKEQMLPSSEKRALKYALFDPIALFLFGCPTICTGGGHISQA